MSRPNGDPKRVEPPAIPSDPADTMAATGIFEPGMAVPVEPSPTLQATQNFLPPGDDATIQLSNPSFSRVDPRPDLTATLMHDPGTAPTRPGLSSSSPAFASSSAATQNAPTLDGEGRTNAFSMSSLDGSAEVVLNDLPHVAGYKLLAELGRGGMGVVYKARQVKLDRLVALKMVLAGAHASQSQLERFMIEARAVASLKHAHIVQIHDVGERDNMPFFSLEYIDGGSLQQTIDSKPQPVRYAAKTVKTLCEAMAFAHSQNIIHRDLKPANVLMTKSGEPKITDFGLAKRLEGDSQQTRDGAIMGTPSYMAPEQAWGLTAEIGPAADQHALGAILYEMLTGRPPYQGATPLDTLDQVRNQEPVPPTRLQPKLPKDLETIALKALQKDPKKRYPSCEEMAEDLERYLDGQPIKARPVSAPERAFRWCKRNPVVAGLTTLAASLLISVAGVATYAAVALSQQNSALEDAKAKETDAKLVALKNEQKAVENEKRAIERERETKAIAMAANEQTLTMIEAQRYISILANLRLRDIPGTLDVRREMFKVALMSLDRATKDVEKLKDAGAGSMVAESMALRTLAGIHQQRGIIYVDMGPRYADKVWPEFDEMQKLAEKHYQLDPADLEALKNLASSNLTLGENTLKLKQQPANAETFLLRAVELRREWLRREPTYDTPKHALANAIGALAGLYQVTGNPDKAIPLYNEEQELRNSVSVETSRDSEFQREFAGLKDKLGDLAMRKNEPEKALKYYEEALAIRVDVARNFPDVYQAQRDILLSMQKLGDHHLIVAKDPKRAYEYYSQAVDGFRKRIEADPNSNGAKNDLAKAHYFAGTAALEMNDLPTSDKHYAENLDIRMKQSEAADKIDANRGADIDLMLALARANRHEDAAKIATAFVKDSPKEPFPYIEAAWGFGLCAAGAERVKPDDKALAKGYRDAGFKALEGALARGWRSPQDIAIDPDFAPLRTDERFPALLAEFEKAASAR